MRLKFIKKHKKDSIRWLNRHLNDEFFQLAKKQGYRSRSSYKLLQINEKFNFLESRKNILDLGCAPGGWLQVSKKLAPKDAKILGIDKLEMSPINGVSFYQEDIFDENIYKFLKSFFKTKIDLLMSDMSPNSTGNKKVDHLRIISLVDKVIDIADKFLEKDGIVVIKIFQGGAQGDLITKMKKSLLSIKNFKPKASRNESPEIYLIAKKK